MRRTLDWVSRHDPRSRDFRISAPAELRTHSWACRPHLDQGQEGACVGFGWAHEIAAAPKTHAVDNAFAFTLYHRAQQLDDIPDSQQGSSVLAGAKASVEAGKVAVYRWAFGIDDVLSAISHLGPVVLGIPWLDTMFDLGPDAILNTEGNVAGGHCILARGVKLAKSEPEPLVRLRNSWGPDWGHRGDAYIRASDLERLLADSGEACVATDS